MVEGCRTEEKARRRWKNIWHCGADYPPGEVYRKRRLSFFLIKVIYCLGLWLGRDRPHGLTPGILAESWMPCPLSGPNRADALAFWQLVNGRIGAAIAVRDCFAWRHMGGEIPAGLS